MTRDFIDKYGNIHSLDDLVAGKRRTAMFAYVNDQELWVTRKYRPTTRFLQNLIRLASLFLHRLNSKIELTK